MHVFVMRDNGVREVDRQRVHVFVMRDNGVREVDRQRMHVFVMRDNVCAWCPSLFLFMLFTMLVVP